MSEASDAISNLKKSFIFPRNGVTVKIREGVYEMTETLSLGLLHSGESDTAAVRFEAYGDDEVVLSSSKSFLLSDFDISEDERIDEAVRGKIYSIDLSGKEIENLGAYAPTGHSVYYLDCFNLITEVGGAPPVILNNGNTMNIARYPNEGYMKVGEVVQNSDVVRNWNSDMKGTLEYVEEEDRSYPPKNMIFEISEPEKIEKWENASDAWLFGYWYYDWSDQTTPIKKFDTVNNTIETKYPSAYGIRSGQRFYIYNLLEELDMPGEWYYDKKTSTLFVYPTDTSSDSTISIAHPLNEIIRIENAKNIIFDGIDIVCSSGKGINVQNSSNIMIKNCTVSDVADVGINISGGNNVVVSCNKITRTGRKGISVLGGDYSTLTPCGHTIENNDISDFGRIVKTYEGGITSSGVGIIIKNNKIYNGPHTGMVVGGNDCIVEDNEIYDVLKEAADMGAIYSGKSMVKRGNIFKGNFIHDCHTDSNAEHIIYAIYFDDQLCGQTVEDNIICNFGGTGVFVNGGRDNNIWNNIFSELTGDAITLNCAGRAKNWGSEINFEERLGLTSTPYQSKAYSKYPHLANILEDEPMDPKYNVVKGNRYYNVKSEINISLLNNYGSDMTLEEFLSKNTIQYGDKLNDPYVKE